MPISPNGFSSARKNYRAFLWALVVAAAASPFYAPSAGATSTIVSGFNSLTDTTPFSGLPSGQTTAVQIFSMNATNQSVAFNGNGTFGGEVGIGSSTPQANLDINAGTTEGIRVVTSTQNPYGIMINDAKYGSTDATGFGLWQGSSGSARFDVAGTTYLSISPSGAVSIGQYASGTLQVHTGTNQNLMIEPDTIGTGGETILSYNDAGNGNEGLSFGASQFDFAGGDVGIGTPSPQYPLDVNGNIRATAYFHSSDARLKTDIRPITGALDKLMALHGVTFTWKQDGRPDMGVVAQDVAKVFPDIVSRGADGQGMMAVEYDSLAGPMIESIRELKMENDAMKAELVAIKATLKAMQDRDASLHDAVAGGQNRAATPSSTLDP